MNNLPLLTLTGPSGTGKSTIENYLSESEFFTKAISYTSRPIRENEINGENYYYVSEEKIKDMYNNDEMAEFIEYNGNYYGVSKEELNKSNVIVIEPNGLKAIKKLLEGKRKIISIYLDLTEEEMRKRMSKRGDSLEDINKRIENDKIHFKYDPKFYNYKINTEGTISSILKTVYELYKINCLEG